MTALGWDHFQEPLIYLSNLLFDWFLFQLLVLLFYVDPILLLLLMIYIDMLIHKNLLARLGQQNCLFVLLSQVHFHAHQLLLYARLDLEY